MIDMGQTELKAAMAILRKDTLFPADIRKANTLIAQSGIRVNDIAVALHWAEKGDTQQAKLAAKRAATAISSFIR
mgnify:CR=1 FL=1